MPNGQHPGERKAAARRTRASQKTTGEQGQSPQTCVCASAPDVSCYEIVATARAAALAKRIPGRPAESLMACVEAFGTMHADCWRSLWRRFSKKNTKQYAR